MGAWLIAVTDWLHRALTTVFMGPWADVAIVVLMVAAVVWGWLVGGAEPPDDSAAL